MHCADSGFAEFLLDREIEVRRVHADKHLRADRLSGADHIAAQHEKLRQLFQHLNIAPDGKHRRVMPDAEPCGPHLFSSDAKLQSAAHRAFHRRDHQRRERITARLSGEPHDTVPERLIRHRPNRGCCLFASFFHKSFQR